MNLTFTPLNHFHFTLLLKWLNEPHVKTWWDQDIHWTPNLIECKYTSYTQGFAFVDDIAKPIHAFVIEVNSHPTGYIQYYNAYDFSRTPNLPLNTLPPCLAAIDFYVGDPHYLGKGVGAPILKTFLEQHVFNHFENCFVDPDSHNNSAIKTYQQSGFNPIQAICAGNSLPMMCTRTEHRDKNHIP